MERRKHHRIPVGQPMAALLTPEDGAQTQGMVLDLNNAGAFIATDEDFQRNTVVEVELEVPGESPVRLRALVARKTGPIEGRERTIPAGVGLVFLTESVMERAFIQRAVLEALKASLETTRQKLAADGSRKAGSTH